MDLKNVHVISITATQNRPSQYTIMESGNTITVYSSSVLIQAVLVPAMVSEVTLDLQLVDNSNLIQRVYFFEPGQFPSLSVNGEYYILRIATQTNGDGSVEHLEVDLNGPNGNLAANVYHPLLMQLLTAIFSYRGDGGGEQRFDATIVDNVVTSVTYPGVKRK